MQVEATDDCSGIDKVLVYINDKDYRATWNPPYWTYIWPEWCILKICTLYAEAWDKAGNSATSDTTITFLYSNIFG